MYERILVPIDESETAHRGLLESISMARATGASLEIVHVIDPYPLAPDWVGPEDFKALRDKLEGKAKKLLADAAHEAERAGVRARVRLREVSVERIADVIRSLATEYACGLVVMGTHGRHGLDRFFLGSTAEAVLRISPVPVLLVPSHRAGEPLPA